jgi:hypothetical protein
MAGIVNLACTCRPRRLSAAVPRPQAEQPGADAL